MKNRAYWKYELEREAAIERPYSQPSLAARRPSVSRVLVSDGLAGRYFTLEQGATALSAVTP